MRIIAGEARGRRLAPVQSPRVRPTGDRVREAVFSLLLARFGLPGPQTGCVLDLYAGSGALGLEALSRGAARAHFVESDGAAAATVQANLERCGFTGRGRVTRARVGDVLAAGGRRLGPEPCQLIFLDPPYAADGELVASLALLEPPLLAADAVVVAEHDTRQTLPEMVGSLHLVHHRAWGGTAMSFYRPAAAASAA